MKKIFLLSLTIVSFLNASSTHGFKQAQEFKKNNNVFEKSKGFNLDKEEVKNKINFKERAKIEQEQRECLSKATTGSEKRKCMGYKDNSHIYKNINATNISEDKKKQLMQMKKDMGIKMQP